MPSIAQSLRFVKETIAATYGALEMLEAAVEAQAGAVKSHPTITLIQQMTASHFGITRARMLRRDRSAGISTARNVAMSLCRQLTTFSLAEIGHDFGGYDHSTISTALHTITARCETEPRFAQTFAILRERVRVAIEPLDVGAGRPAKQRLRVGAKLGDFSKVSSGPFTEGVSRG